MRASRSKASGCLTVQRPGIAHLVQPLAQQPAANGGVAFSRRSFINQMCGVQVMCGKLASVDFPAAGKCIVLIAGGLSDQSASGQPVRMLARSP